MDKALKEWGRVQAEEWGHAVPEWDKVREEILEEDKEEVLEEDKADGTVGADSGQTAKMAKIQKTKREDQWNPALLKIARGGLLLIIN